nr:DUF6465 family protein [uncultured Lachnoclostridium sp.]
MVEAKKDVKTAAGPAEETVKQVVEEEVKAAAPAAEAPAAKETKAPAKKAPAKKAPAKTAAAKKETVKKETAKKETEKKAPAKAAAAKAAPAKKPAAKKAEPAAAVHFQFDGKDLVAKDVLDQAVKAYKSTHKGVEIKTIELYIVANEGAAYYVVNGEGNDDFKIML